MYPTNLIQTLKQGGIAVVATDTLYGIVASALHKDAVEKIYALKARDFDKPFIILLASPAQVKDFGVELSPEQKTYLNSVWPGKVSVILPLGIGAASMYAYLHRKKGSLAFRVPAKAELRELLKQTGPLVAPSANTQANEPATTIAEAKRYFGNEVDMYIDEGLVTGSPSKLVDYTHDKITILRN